MQSARAPSPRERGRAGRGKPHGDPSHAATMQNQNLDGLKKRSQPRAWSKRLPPPYPPPQAGYSIHTSQNPILRQWVTRTHPLGQPRTPDPSQGIRKTHVFPLRISTERIKSVHSTAACGGRGGGGGGGPPRGPAPPLFPSGGPPPPPPPPPPPGGEGVRAPCKASHAIAL